MPFNCPAFVDEFKAFVGKLRVRRILEVGALSCELMNAVGADGIDLDPRHEGVVKADIREFVPAKPYALVFSSGLIEHYDRDEARAILQAKAQASRKYVLTYVPHTGCEAYMRAKERTKAPWKGELDFTPETLAELHTAVGLEVVETGLAAAEWPNRFAHEPSEPYLVYCLCLRRS